MEVHFTPELQATIDRLAIETGRPVDELLEDAVTGYAAELSEMRQMLDSRYDEAVSGKAVLIDGEEAFAILMSRTAAERNRRG